MKKLNRLIILKAYHIKSDILQTKVINNELYIFDKNSLYQIEDNEINPIKRNIQYFSNAFDKIEDKIISIHFRNDNELIYAHEDIFELIIELSKKAKVKDVFLFYNIGSAVIQFDDSSIDIYLLNNNKVLTNIAFDENIEYIYKSYSTHELIITLESKIIFLDILTLKTNKTIVIDKTDFIGVNYLNNKVHIIYKKYIKLIDDNFNQTNIEMSIDDDISKVFINHGLNELIIVTKTNKILLYHLYTNSIFLIYHYSREIQDIRFIDYNLYIVSKNNISLTDTAKGSIELKKYLLLEDVKSSLDLIQENPFLLLDNNLFNKIEVFWNDSFKEISNKSFMNKPEEAEEIFEKFSFINSYKNDYINILDSKDIFINILKSLRVLKYDEVFRILEKNPFIKTSAIGQKIIYDWDYLFEKFIEYILKYNFNENAKEYQNLKKYETDISKKKLIATVIKNKHVIFTAVNAYKNNHFLVYSRLIDKYSFLKDLPITKGFEKRSLNIYNKILHYIDIEDFERALYAIEHIQDFHGFQNKVKKLKKKVNVIKGFKSLYERKNITKCRVLLEQYEEYFQYSEYYYKIVKDDLKNMELAIAKMNKGEFETTYKILKELFHSDIWVYKIKFIMAEYYKQKFQLISYNLNEDTVDLYINNFYKLFGYVDKIFTEDSKDMNDIDNVNMKQIKRIQYYPKDLLD